MNQLDEPTTKESGKLRLESPECSEQSPLSTDSELPLTRIKPASGWQVIDFRELWRFRELLYFLTWRDVKVRYKQHVLGAIGQERRHRHPVSVICAGRPLALDVFRQLGQQLRSERGGERTAGDEDLFSSHHHSSRGRGGRAGGLCDRLGTFGRDDGLLHGFSKRADRLDALALAHSDAGHARRGVGDR